MRNQEKVELKNIFNELKKGNKNVIEELYKKYNKMIYGIAYTIKMSYKGTHKIDGFFEYVVPPLERILVARRYERKYRL